MPVGTRGAIKYLSAADYERLGAEIVLGNTYHLMLRPGAETVAALGGLGKFAGWNGLTLTDSGGFQVFSLDPDVDDDGVTFKSTYDGSTHRFTPEIAVHTQELLGADIQMVLDVCPPTAVAAGGDPAGGRADRGVGRRWPRAAHRRDDQALFGIVQGGVERGAAVRRAPSGPSRSSSTGTASVGSAWARPVARWCRRLLLRLRTCPRTARGT